MYFDLLYYDKIVSMKKQKNVLLSLTSFILAPVWIWIVSVFSQNSIPLPVILRNYFSVSALPYFVLILIGIFFGWKNLKSNESPLIGNIITLLGIIMFFASILYYAWLIAWIG